MARPPHRGAVLRCAMYTRKSHEEGLEQAFNSLDAQREACEAYVRSQKHEGWTPLPEMYDDGGISGATMERPALQRLLADIETGKIDTVVVYKVDRLTRSLSDFAKIVDIFDRKAVSFVSVTQQFNTTTSMGRLTLNMLLSFAQFEREVTGERIRDKIAASKKKGMWMGGKPPLGYDVADRKLVINHDEAETVRHIYRRYRELGSVALLKQDLEMSGVRSKPRTDRFGHRTGGTVLARGALYHMLQNRLYLGETPHRKQSYPGEHDAIVDRELWDQVQAVLAASRSEHRSGARAEQPSLLVGLVFDDVGTRMTATHANKKGRRYRYYVSGNLLVKPRAEGATGRRIPANDLERLVQHRLIALLRSEPELHNVAGPHLPDMTIWPRLRRQAMAMADAWPHLKPSERRALLQATIAKVAISRTALDLHLQPVAIINHLLDTEEPRQRVRSSVGDATVVLPIPARLKRTGMEMRLIIDGVTTEDGTPNAALMRLLGQAHRYQQIFLRGGQSISDMATEVGVARSFFTRVLRLSFLDPNITRAILAGRQPIGITTKSMTADSRLPLRWSDQRTLMRFA